MREKVNGVYQPLYPQTYWQQVIGADNQIATVNNRISTVQSNLQGQINQKQDASTAINQGNIVTNVGNFTGKWVTLTNKRITTTQVSPSDNANSSLVAGTSLKGIVALKQVTTLYTLQLVNNSSHTPYFYIHPFGPTFSAPNDYDTYVSAINRTFTEFGYLLSGPTYGFRLNTVGNYPQETRSLIFSGATTTRGDSYENVSAFFDINPTTYQMLTNVPAFSGENYRGDSFSVDMQVVIYGLQVTQGDFPTL